MNEVEDGFQLGATLQHRAAVLLPAYYSASIRSQRLDLGINLNSAVGAWYRPISGGIFASRL